MDNKHIETGTIFRKGDMTDAFGNDISHAVRKVVAGHQRDLQGPHGATAGKRITYMPDGTAIVSWVNPYGLAPTLVSQVITPKPEEEPIEGLPGIVAFIPSFGYLGDIRTGGLFTMPRYTYSAPYTEATGLLGTAYTTTIVGQEGDLRASKPASCGWLATKPEGGSSWTATRGHSGYFGTQNWLGHTAKDVLSWDGPKSRYFKSLGASYPNNKRRIYHRLRVLADLTTYAAAAGWDVWGIMGAGINHDEEGNSWLYIITITSNYWKLRAFRWQLSAITSEEEGDEFTDRYSVVGDPALLHTLDLHALYSADPTPAPTGTLRTGFYFNASGTDAVCTMAGGMYQTYLHHFNIITGFSRELAYDAAAQVKDSGTIKYPALLNNYFVEVGDAYFVPHPSAPVPCLGQYFIGGWNSSVTDTDEKTYTYTILSIKQIVCADYKGDILVYLYQENPEAVHTYALSSTWSGSFIHWNCESYWYGEYPCLGNIAGTLLSWNVSSHVDVTVSARKIYSSDSSLSWESDTCSSHIYMDGSPGNVQPGDGVYPGNQVPPGRLRECEDPFTLNAKLVSNSGWSSDNLASCAGNKKEHLINFLDLRFGLMIVEEMQWDESADVDWGMSFGDNGEQYFTMEETIKFIIVSGSSVLEEAVISHVQETLPIGLPINKYGIYDGTTYGIDYWYRMYDFYVPMPNDPEAVGSEMWQGDFDTAKVWYSCTIAKPQGEGSGSMLSAGGDIIYTLPYGGTVFDPSGINPGVANVGPMDQISVWATSRNPQLDFFDKDVTTHFLSNLALI